MLWGCNLEKLSRLKAGVRGIRTDWSGIGGGPRWPAGCEVRRAAAAPRSARCTAGTLRRRSSSRTAARGHRRATRRPARRSSHSTASVSCTPPGADRKNRQKCRRMIQAGQATLDKCEQRATGSQTIREYLSLLLSRALGLPMI